MFPAQPVLTAGVARRGHRRGPRPTAVGQGRADPLLLAIALALPKGIIDMVRGNPASQTPDLDRLAIA